MDNTENLPCICHLLTGQPGVNPLLTGLSLAIFVCSCKICWNIAAQSEGFAGLFFSFGRQQEILE